MNKENLLRSTRKDKEIKLFLIGAGAFIFGSGAMWGPGGVFMSVGLVLMFVAMVDAIQR